MKRFLSLLVATLSVTSAFILGGAPAQAGPCPTNTVLFFYYGSNEPSQELPVYGTVRPRRSMVNLTGYCDELATAGADDVPFHYIPGAIGVAARGLNAGQGQVTKFTLLVGNNEVTHFNVTAHESFLTHEAAKPVEDEVFSDSYLLDTPVIALAPTQTDDDTIKGVFENHGEATYNSWSTAI